MCDLWCLRGEQGADTASEWGWGVTKGSEDTCNKLVKWVENYAWALRVEFEGEVRNVLELLRKLAPISKPYNFGDVRSPHKQM